MELVLNSTYDGYYEFKSKALETTTSKIFKAGKALVKSYATIGQTLIKIKDEELYKEDFQSFSDYTKEVLGISQTVAYSMMAVCNRFLLDDKEKNGETQFFTNFADTALQSLLPLKMDYDETKSFCELHSIDETTPVSEVRKFVKSYRSNESTPETVDEADETEINEPSEDNITVEHITPRDIIVEALREIESDPAIYKAAKENPDLTAFIKLFGACLDFFKITMNKK